MSEKKDHYNVQVKVPNKIYKKAKMRLIDEGLTWQDILSGYIRKYSKGRNKKSGSKN